MAGKNPLVRFIFRDDTYSDKSDARAVFYDSRLQGLTLTVNALSHTSSVTAELRTPRGSTARFKRTNSDGSWNLEYADFALHTGGITLEEITREEHDRWGKQYPGIDHIFAAIIQYERETDAEDAKYAAKKKISKRLPVKLLKENI